MKDNEPIPEDYYLKYPRQEEAKNSDKYIPTKEGDPEYTSQQLRNKFREANKELQSLRDQLANKDNAIKDIVFQFCEYSDPPYALAFSHPPALTDRWNNWSSKYLKDAASKQEAKDKEIQQLKEQLQAKEKALLSKMELTREQAQRIKELEEALRESNSACESVLSLETLIRYSEPIKPEHEGEATAISSMLLNIKLSTNKARKLLLLKNV